ncbi:MAG: hypothetical protein LKI42_03195 [Bacteroidales bacterium]|jgi:hypothetical protein|nr:hypothetical protein [Bacteroidales bacterium]MCI1785315.1 hypothetical protein [Bacteroidales bacterium]
MKKFIMVMAAAVAVAGLEGKVAAWPSAPEDYALKKVIEVQGRQGVACDGVYYYISGSGALYKYALDGTLVASNPKPFEGLELPANHIGDIDVYDGKLYAGIETFRDGAGCNIQVAVYDASTLKYDYSIPWLSASGQKEVCGLAVDRVRGRVWMADWVQGSDLYCYDLKTRRYIGKEHLRPAPRLQQGIYCLDDGRMLISCDDGDADYGQADRIYFCNLHGRDIPLQQCGLPVSADVEVFRDMTDFRKPGEIEGLTQNPETGELIVLSNRGARIELGMPVGFYDGYDREIHEIYIYSPIIKRLISK